MTRRGMRSFGDWMGLGIGSGRDWSSGRYAIFLFMLDPQAREGRGEPRRKECCRGSERIPFTDISTSDRHKRRFIFANTTLDTCSFSANRPRPQTPLDSIKFVCKDLWPLLFRKQIDNLKTNHRGVFVLTDQRFQPLSRVSVDRKAGVKAPEETLSRAQAVSLRRRTVREAGLY